MKKIKEMDVKKVSIIVLLVIMFCLVFFGVFYAIKNYNREDIVTIDTKDIKRTIGDGQLDSVSQPDVNVEVKYYVLPETKSTLEYINTDTLKKLFQNQTKSIVVVSDDTCTNCADYLPILESALKKYNLSAYIINLNDLDEKGIHELYQYVYYEGTPTTYIIQSSKVNHVLTGSVDEETILSFIDYFYIRNN